MKNRDISPNSACTMGFWLIQGLVNLDWTCGCSRTRKIIKQAWFFQAFCKKNGANIFDRSSTKKVVLDRKEIGSFVARVFGVMSPNIKTIIVVKTVAIALPALSPNRLTNIIVATEAINILTKLLPTNIPPIVFSIFSLALLILLFFLFSSN